MYEVRNTYALPIRLDEQGETRKSNLTVPTFRSGKHYPIFGLEPKGALDFTHPELKFGAIFCAASGGEFNR